jgi:hypothetical protein
VTEPIMITTRQPGAAVSQTSGPTTDATTRVNGLALAGMICGIVSVTTFWIPFVFLVSGLAVGIVAVVLSHRGRSGGTGRKQALAGLVCGYAGIALSIANAVAGAFLLS